MDADRVYITGVSMGGFGVWNYLSHYPNLYAAAVPICGGLDGDTTPSKLSGIPIWDFHAADDPVVNVYHSRNIICAVRQWGGKPIYTEYDTGGHGIATAAFTTPGLMDWLYAQKLGAVSTLSPRLSIQAPEDPAFATTEAVFKLSGTASDGRTDLTSVTWTNYHYGGTAIAGGTAVGRSSWVITNLTLSAGNPNLIVVIGKGTSFNAALRGSTTFNDALSLTPPKSP
jgi:pimeloyl-ACP methyl ester carboxylesterase